MNDAHRSKEHLFVREGISRHFHESVMWRQLNTRDPAERRILSLATYPITTPIHGGQRRVRAIADCYSRSGWQVRHIAAYPRGWYPSTSVGWRGWLRRASRLSEHVEFPKAFARYLQRHDLRADLHAHKYFQQNELAREQLVKSIEEFQPQIIQFEQPWLFPALRDYLRLAGQEYVAVYSSQNVEAHLLQSLLTEQRHPHAEEFAQEARELEEALVRSADLTLCVTQEDASIFRSWGAREVFVAPNGAAQRLCPRASCWEKKTRDHPYAFITGSAHPPNRDGFLKMLGSDFAFVPPGTQIVVAGGMVRLLNASLGFRQDEVARQKTILLPTPTEEDLGYLINHAHVILLPITHGGGSNIKTAEALLSNRPVIGTSTAFRGFQVFRNAPGVIVEDDPSRFRVLVQRALRDGAAPPVHRPDTQQLLWENSVRAIPATVARLLSGDAAC